MSTREPREETEKWSDTTRPVEKAQRSVFQPKLTYTYSAYVSAIHLAKLAG